MENISVFVYIGMSTRSGMLGYFLGSDFFEFLCRGLLRGIRAIRFPERGWLPLGSFTQFIRLNGQALIEF